MKKFTNVLLSVIFTTLIICSIQYASADHLLGDQGIFKDETTIVVEDSIDSKYMIHLQVVVRDAQGQLVSVSERMHGSYIPHEITDYVFDALMGEKEIFIIDDISLLVGVWPPEAHPPNRPPIDLLIFNLFFTL